MLSKAALAVLHLLLEDEGYGIVVPYPPFTTGFSPLTRVTVPDTEILWATFFAAAYLTIPLRNYNRKKKRRKEKKKRNRGDTRASDSEPLHKKALKKGHTSPTAVAWCKATSAQPYDQYRSHHSDNGRET